MAADDSLAAFDAAQSWGDAMKALNEWREKAENTPPETPDGPVGDFPCYEAFRQGVTPGAARVERYAEAINRAAVTDSAELVRDLADAVIAVADEEQVERDRAREECGHEKAMRRFVSDEMSGWIRMKAEQQERAEAAERARDDALARAEVAEAVLASHELANGGCVPKPAYDDLAAELRRVEAERDDAGRRLRALLAVQEPPAATEDTPTEQDEAK